MASLQSKERASSLVDRLDSIQMSAADRRRARMMLRQEEFADALAALQGLLRRAAKAFASAFADFPERMKSALSAGTHR